MELVCHEWTASLSFILDQSFLLTEQIHTIDKHIYMGYMYAISIWYKYTYSKRACIYTDTHTQMNDFLISENKKISQVL